MSLEREPWTEQESLTTVSSLGSWNACLHSCASGVQSPWRPCARTQNPVELIRPCGNDRRACPDWPNPALGAERLPAGFPSRHDRPTSRFSRDPSCSHAGFCESCSLSEADPSPPRAHALGTRNSKSIPPVHFKRKLYLQPTDEKGIAASTDAPANPDPARRSPETLSRKPSGHLPSPEDGPQTLTRPVTGLLNAPLGAVLRAAPLLSEASESTAGRPPLCSALRCHVRTIINRAIPVPNL